MNEFIVHDRPNLSPFAAPWATFGVPLWQLIEDIRENKDGMLDRLKELSAQQQQGGENNAILQDLSAVRIEP